MKHKKIALIVEDNYILNLLYDNFLRKLGFDTESYTISGNAAIEMAKKINPDLIIMDISLKGKMDGIEAVQEIRKFSSAPVIYVTANSSAYYKIRAEETGYLDFLIKPIEFEELKTAVNEYWETEKITNQ